MEKSLANNPDTETLDTRINLSLHVILCLTRHKRKKLDTFKFKKRESDTVFVHLAAKTLQLVPIDYFSFSFQLAFATKKFIVLFICYYF